MADVLKQIEFRQNDMNSAIFNPLFFDRSDKIDYLTDVFRLSFISELYCASSCRREVRPSPHAGPW